MVSHSFPAQSVERIICRLLVLTQFLVAAFVVRCGVYVAALEVVDLEITTIGK